MRKARRPAGIRVMNVPHLLPIDHGSGILVSFQFFNGILVFEILTSR